MNLIKLIAKASQKRAKHFTRNQLYSDTHVSVCLCVSVCVSCCLKNVCSLKAIFETFPPILLHISSLKVLKSLLASVCVCVYVCLSVCLCVQKTTKCLGKCSLAFCLGIHTTKDTILAFVVSVCATSKNFEKYF